MKQNEPTAWRYTASSGEVVAPDGARKQDALVAIQAAFMAAIKDNPTAVLGCLAIARTAAKAWSRE